MSLYTSSGGPIIQNAFWNGGNQLGQPLTLGSADANSLTVVTNAVTQLTINTGGDIICGNAALATTATAGFFWMAGCAGAATGTPAATATGRVPMVFDTTNGRLYAYYGGAWKYGAIAT